MRKFVYWVYEWFFELENPGWSARMVIKEKNGGHVIYRKLSKDQQTRLMSSMIKEAMYQTPKEKRERDKMGKRLQQLYKIGKE